MIKHILSTQFQNLRGKHERDEGHKHKKGQSRVHIWNVDFTEFYESLAFLAEHY